jgi:hypothetical protein
MDRRVIPYSYVSSFEFVPNSVLIPKEKMSLAEKLYYALCVTANRRKFSYGRKPKGDRLKAILLPAVLLKKYNRVTFYIETKKCGICH